MKSELKGVHCVKARLAGGETAFYYYAWRGGPRIVDPKTERPLTDPNTPAFRAAFDALRRPQISIADQPTVRTLIAKYKSATEFTKLAQRTRTDYALMLDKIGDEFGTMPIAALSSPKTRGAFMEWRDTLASKPRMADYAWSVLARLMSVSKNRGYISVNPCEKGGRLYESDRIDNVWTEEALARLFAVCSPEVFDVVMLALWTGQRQGDLLKLTWFNYDGTHIRLRQGKTKRRVIVPVGPTLQGTLAEIPRLESQFILNSSDGRAWTADGFKSSFFRAVQKANVEDLTFHDLRGTAVTRLALAGCPAEEIATITGHSFRDVNSILDSHYLSRDVKLAEQAIDRLEKKRSGTPTVKRPVKRSLRSHQSET
ncbi:tyrosine-type recombinase/integrase [Lichenihabitans psoromatis]|uniref:tyrosine-type recombinase/integrase n=1 Tax=Lichenihabitans psoromatis TaxID=2528642 RepID=UPI001FE12654|nr:tyrosine-type recombinase/integrase [Lichenihabitans psoromatis]